MQRIEDGPYKKAFINHQKRGRTEKIPIWKEVLRKVVDYKGFGMDEVNGRDFYLVLMFIHYVLILIKTFDKDFMLNLRLSRV